MSAVFRRLDDGATFTLDAAPNATITKAIAVTSFEVEEGVDLTDHARRMPTEARLEGTVTETPQGSPIVVNGQTVGYTIDGGGETGEARLRAALAFLDESVGREIEIVFPRVLTLGPVLLSGVSFPITPERRLALDLSVREVRKVSARSISMPRARAPKPRNPDAEAEVDKGTKPSTPSDRRSTAKALADLFGLGG